MRVLSVRDQAIVDHARSGAALFGRDDWLPVVATGVDHRKFLHAMLTQDVKGVAEGSMRTTCLCDVQGAVEVAAVQVVLADRVILWTERALAPRLKDELDKFIIMDDLELAIDEDLALIQLVGPQALSLGASLGLPEVALGQWTAGVVGGEPVGVGQARIGGAPGSPAGDTLPCLLVSMSRDVLGDVAGAVLAAGAMPGSHAALDALRIATGWPLLGGQDVDDGSLPLEIGLKPAVDYRKGCYRGQEAIAMMTYRGQIRRHLCWVERDGAQLPEPGWNLRTVDGKRAGRMGTSVLSPDGRWLGLAVVQRKAYAEGAILKVESPGGDATTVRVVATTVPGVLESATGAA